MLVKKFHRPVSLITAFGDKVRVTPGVLANFSTALYNNNINVYAVSTGSDSLTMVVDFKDEERAFNILRDTIRNGPSAFNELVLRSNKAIVCIEATEHTETPGVAHTSIKDLAKENINILEMFSSYGSITIVLERKDLERGFELIVNALKEKFEIRED